MIKKFEIILEKDDHDDDLLPYTNASQRDYFLFELKHNFFRKWKHADVDPTLDEVETALNDLFYEHNVITP